MFGLFVVIVATGFLFESSAVSWIALGFGVMLAGIAARRTSSKARVKQLHQVGELTACNVLVVGSADDAQPYLQAAHESGRQLKVVAFVPADRGLRSASGGTHSDVCARVERFLDQAVVDEVVVATTGPLAHLDRLGLSCVQRGLAFRTLIRLPEADFGRYSVAPLGPSAYLLSVETVPQSRWPLAIKRLMDVLGALVGLCLCGVAYLWYGLRIRKQSGGAIIFRQRRIGRNGRSFTVFKFRTMYVDAEARLAELLAHNQMRGCMFKIADDPRITPIGKVLRRRHLDELPQFWNVLRGEMSLVGTRPPTPDEVASYRSHHRRRLSMKPGITGLWQIRGNHLINDFEEIVKLDCRYIDIWSLWLDCKILLKTVPKVLRGNGW